MWCQGQCPLIKQARVVGLVFRWHNFLQPGIALSWSGRVRLPGAPWRLTCRRIKIMLALIRSLHGWSESHQCGVSQWFPMLSSARWHTVLWYQQCIHRVALKNKLNARKTHYTKHWPFTEDLSEKTTTQQRQCCQSWFFVLAQNRTNVTAICTNCTHLVSQSFYDGHLLIIKCNYVIKYDERSYLVNNNYV
jgi:hypothetical protein